jgi:hypothetical protein
MLPPKKGYVEVEVDGKRTYRNVETGVLIEDEKPTPTIDERVTDLEDALAATDETAIELYESMAAQEEINTAQDEALIAIYEMIGG